MKKFLKSLSIGAIMLMSTSVWASTPSTPIEKEKHAAGLQDVEQVKCKITIQICGTNYDYTIVTSTEKDCKSIQSVAILASLFLQNCN